MSNYDYNFINNYNALFSPSTVHCKNTGLVNYMTRYNLNKILATYKISGMPEKWAKNFVQYVLYCQGFMAVLNTDLWGIIPQNCALVGYNVQYQPRRALITNPYFDETYDLEIGTECEILRILPDYDGVMDIVGVYSDLMALALETSGISMLNSRLAMVFGVETQAQRESFAKMLDKLLSGDPAVFVDKSLFTEDGQPSWVQFVQNLGQNYISDRILADMDTLEHQFNVKMGIPDIYEKKERVTNDEIAANNADSSSLPRLIIENLSESMEKVNDLFGLNLSVEYIHGGNDNGEQSFSESVRPE